MLLSLVTSQVLSPSSPRLVGRLVLLERGGISGWPSMRSSRLVWERIKGSSGLSTFPFPPSLPPTYLPLDTRGGFGTPAPIEAGGPLVGFIVCHPPLTREMTEALCGRCCAAFVWVPSMCARCSILSTSSHTNSVNVPRSIGSDMELVNSCRP